MRNIKKIARSAPKKALRTAGAGKRPTAVNPTLLRVARAIYARNPEIDRKKPLVFSWEAVGKPDPRIIPWEKAPKVCRDLVLKAAQDALDACGHADLVKALQIARDCIAYCRRAHRDAQSGGGVPVEVFIDDALAKAAGADVASTRKLRGIKRATS